MNEKLNSLFISTILACSAALLAVASAQEAAPLPPQTVAEPRPQPRATPQCKVDLRKTGQMEDVISNVLLRAEHKPASEVQTFLKDVQSRYATGDDLLKAAAEHFKIDQKRLAALVEHWRHINCRHAAIPGYAVPDLDPVPVSVFATDVTLRDEINSRASKGAMPEFWHLFVDGETKVCQFFGMPKKSASRSQSLHKFLTIYAATA